MRNSYPEAIIVKIKSPTKIFDGNCSSWLKRWDWLLVLLFCCCKPRLKHANGHETWRFERKHGGNRWEIVRAKKVLKSVENRLKIFLKTF